MKKDKSTQKLLKAIKETPEQRHERVVAEGNRFRSRTVPMKGKNQYDRNSKVNRAALRSATDF